MTDRHLGQPVACEIEFEGCDGTRLAGTLTLPRGTGQFPVVVAVHAAGGGTRDAPLHRHLASFLPSLGVAASSMTGAGKVPSMAGPALRLPCSQGTYGPPCRSSPGSPQCGPAGSGCGVTAKVAGSGRWPQQAMTWSRS